MLSANVRRALLPAARAAMRHVTTLSAPCCPVAVRRAPVFAVQQVWGARAFASSAGQVQLIEDLPAFKAAVEERKGGLIVAYHTAAWCGPCKMVWPHVQKMAEENPNVAFLKIDVDEASDVAASNNIQAMPTFLLLKGGKEVDKIVGANPAGLKESVTKHQ